MGQAVFYIVSFLCGYFGSGWSGCTSGLPPTAFFYRDVFILFFSQEKGSGISPDMHQQITKKYGT